MATEWEPDQRDDQLRSISHLTRGIALTAVGATVVLGVGIAWGDQQRVDQAEKRDTSPSLPPGATVNPPPSAPTAPTSVPSQVPQSSSGGS